MMVKKIPLRQCLGCRQMKPKTDLVRVVKTPQGDIKIDKQGKLPGRGAYLCKEENCLKKTMKSRALERGFSKAIDPKIFEELTLQLAREEVAEHGK